MGKNSSSAYRRMTHDVYIVKTRTNKHKHANVLLTYVNKNVNVNLTSNTGSACS